MTHISYVDEVVIWKMLTFAQISFPPCPKSICLRVTDPQIILSSDINMMGSLDYDHETLDVETNHDS